MIEMLKKNNLIILEAVCGSRSFGLATPESDTDIHGVYVATPRMLSTLDGKPPASIKDEKHNTEYWEIRQFLELLREGKPNALELLHSPPDCVIRRDAYAVDLIGPPGRFLSKACPNTFYRYAMAQVVKSRGQNKKIVNPEDGVRKSLLDFCHVLKGSHSYRLMSSDIDYRKIGLTSVPHAKDLYVMFETDGSWPASGIVRDPETSCDVSLSSVPKDADFKGYLSVNRDGYANHCRKYREYKEWVEKRNPVRYEGTLKHGQGYDAKNMMHTFRLLQCGLEISEGKGLRVRRTPEERERLLAIKRGEFRYEELVAEAEAMSERLTGTDLSTLPEAPEVEELERILYKIRRQRG